MVSVMNGQKTRKDVRTRYFRCAAAYRPASPRPSRLRRLAAVLAAAADYAPAAAMITCGTALAVIGITML